MVCDALQRGTLDYMAPEMLHAREYDSQSDEPLGLHFRRSITTAVDVYSFGLVLWQIITAESLDRAAGGLRQPRCALHGKSSTEACEAMLIRARQERHTYVAALN